MTTYAVFDRDASDAPTVVPDRFSWFAFLLPPLFALASGLWVEFFLILVVTALIVALAIVIGDAAAFWIYCAAALFFGFEAAALRRGALKRRGWQPRGDLIASGLDAAVLEGIRRRGA